VAALGHALGRVDGPVVLVGHAYAGAVIGYVASYLFIAIIWVNHHHLLQFVRYPTPRLIWLNFAHLFVVSLLPFATAWVARSHLGLAPVTVHAGIFLLVDVGYLASSLRLTTPCSPTRRVSSPGAGHGPHWRSSL